MIPEIGIMVGLYIVTRMLTLVLNSRESISVRLFAALTAIVAAVVMGDLFVTGTTGIMPPQ